MRFYALTLALCGTALFEPLVAVGAEPINQGGAVIRLLNLFASRTDALAVANAGKLLNQGASPVVALAADSHAPLSFLGGWNSPETTRSLTRRLGEYVVEHSDEFANGLPSPSSLQEPLRLGAFFEGMCQPTVGASASSEIFQRDLARLSLLLDDSWMDAAAACGSLDIQHLLFAHRGELPLILRFYQESSDETSLLILGETLASYSEAYRQIEPRDFQLRTLSLLLAGSLGTPQSEPDEHLAIATTAAVWTLDHPGLLEALRSLRDPASLSLLEVTTLWSQDREKSIRMLAATHWISTMTRARLAMELFGNSTLSESDAVPLIRLLPSTMLEKCLKLAKSTNPSSHQTKLRAWITTEISSRIDKGKVTR